MTAAMGRARWWIQTPVGARRYDRRDRHGLAGISSREFVKRELLPAAHGGELGELMDKQETGHRLTGCAIVRIV
jgi:hypothetical protein